MASCKDAEPDTEVNKSCLLRGLKIAQDKLTGLWTCKIPPSAQSWSSPQSISFAEGSEKVWFFAEHFVHRS